MNWYLIFGYALGASFLLSALLTEGTRWAALRFNVLDQPGHRKVHVRAKPLLGGVAIAVTFYVMIAVHLFLVWPAQAMGDPWLQEKVFAFLGERHIHKLVAIMASSFLIFVLGVVDDVRVLSVEKKLIGQVVAAGVLVTAGIRADLFIENPWLSGLATMVWIIGMTNAFNFLDNMDGLSGGVAVISAFAFFMCFLPKGEYFVCLLLMVFAGAVAGFLYHNLHPARIFMGDAGAMFCGFIMGTVAVLGTFYRETDASTRIAVAAPLLALSVPLFDMASVIILRLMHGESIFRGDKRHFSHRLVNIGMSQRQAVDFVLLVAGVTGLGAALLPHVNLFGTVVVIAQTIGIFSLIVLLMNAGARRNGVSQ
jgi:UDP-GlcNAc:undecaprenyl-phosphate GlcNAc-1-phosphate transferase